MPDRTQSAQLHARAGVHVPGGVHSNTRYEAPHPTFYARASGAHLWDVDGERYLDFTMGNGAIMLGHGDHEVDDAAAAAVRAGLTTGMETEAAVRVAEQLAAVIPDFGQVRLANTGTEALLHALRIARHATGRRRVAKAEGAYHGWSDALWVSTWPGEHERGPADAPYAPPSSGGLSAEAATTLVLPFNDLPATERLLRDHAGELAAVVLEPVLIDIGFVPATQAYLDGVRALTAELGIVLVFDELLTGFRLAPGGARETYGVVPDLTCYGKALANGYPLAAVEGSRALMALTDPTRSGPVGWVGTYNGHGVAVAAAAATLPRLADGSAQRRLDDLTGRLRLGFAELSQRYGVVARIAGAGGHFQPYFLDGEVTDYRSAATTNAERYRLLREVAADERVVLPGKPLLHAALSTAHTAADVDRLLAVADKAFARMDDTT